jgi:serine/threonine protein kinase
VTTPVDPNRWARITDLFDRALSVRDEDRSAWLVAICGSDTSLHDEVASLLRVHERAGGFISGPAGIPSPAPPRDTPVPQVPIGPYRVLRVIGAGGMGVVYLAEDPRLGRQVALKAVAPAANGDRDRVERLRREARVAASLVHPNIATVFALEQYDGQWYMVSEYVAGETLRDELSRGPLPVEEAIETVATIARALAVAHARGIVHRDLKPENIVRTPEGALKILDFGLAITDDHASAPLTGDGAAIGTPAYMSPEQIRGTGVDARSDQFALGILLYELVTGTHPFLARTPAATLARILEAVPEPLQVPEASGAGHELADRLTSIVGRCLQKRADHRYADTAALAAALARIDQSRSATTPSPAPRPTALWWWQFHQAAVATSYTLLLLPLWRLRHLPGPAIGVPLFLVGLVAAVVAGALRLHVWFAARQYPDQWLGQHSRARRWVFAGDVVFTIVLFAQGMIAARTDNPSAPLLVAAAAALAVVFLVVEPATTRAAHGPS